MCIHVCSTDMYAHVTHTGTAYCTVYCGTVVLWYCMTVLLHRSVFSSSVYDVVEGEQCHQHAHQYAVLSHTVPQYHSTTVHSTVSSTVIQYHSTTVPQYTVQYDMFSDVLHVHTCQYCIHVTRAHTTCYIIQHVYMYTYMTHTHTRTHVLWYCGTV